MPGATAPPLAAFPEDAAKEYPPGVNSQQLEHRNYSSRTLSPAPVALPAGGADAHGRIAAGHAWLSCPSGV